LNKRKWKIKWKYLSKWNTKYIMYRIPSILFEMDWRK